VTGPTAAGSLDGLAYTLWLPDGEPLAGLVIVHGAGSCKENHHDMAADARAAGFAAVAFDQRGHGASEGALDDRAIDDVVAIAGLLPPGPRVLRGSSMGGAVAILAAERLGARGVVAICPAPTGLLLMGLRAGGLGFRADRARLEPLLAANDLGDVVERSGVPLLLQHAEGDERVPVASSRALARRARAPGSRLDVLPGGDHGSVQHDPGAQRSALAWLREVVRRPRAEDRGAA